MSKTATAAWDFEPCESDALDFAMASSDGFDTRTYHSTSAIRYWKGADGSVYVTHFLWDGPGGPLQLSRNRAISIWVTAFNLIGRILQVSVAVGRDPRVLPKDKLKSDESEAWYSYLRQIQKLNWFITRFFSYLQSPDFSVAELQEWCQRNAVQRHKAIAPFINTKLPDITFPIQVLQALSDALDRQSPLEVVWDFAIKLDVLLEDIIPTPLINVMEEASGQSGNHEEEGPEGEADTSAHVDHASPDHAQGSSPPTSEINTPAATSPQPSSNPPPKISKGEISDIPQYEEGAYDPRYANRHPMTSILQKRAAREGYIPLADS